jgi:cytochrome c peroxidase
LNGCTIDHGSVLRIDEPFSFNRQRDDIVPNDADSRERLMRLSISGAVLSLILAGALASTNPSQQTVSKVPPILEAGRLAMPRSLKQAGLPLAAKRLVIAADNPETPEKIELGKQLFFDGRLSADGTVACSTCHNPGRAFTDGRPTSIGIKGRVGP